MSFTFAAFAYLFGLCAVAILFFLATYTMFYIDEMRTNQMNPLELCHILNQFVLPEYGLHSFILLFFDLSVQLFAIVWNLPLFIYHIKRYLCRRKMPIPGLYEPATIMDQLDFAEREAFGKMVFYFISFFIYLFGLIYTVVTS